MKNYVLKFLQSFSSTLSNLEVPIKIDMLIRNTSNNTPSWYNQYN